MIKGKDWILRHFVPQNDGSREGAVSYSVKKARRKALGYYGTKALGSKHKFASTFGWLRRKAGKSYCLIALPQLINLSTYQPKAILLTLTS